MSHYKLVLIGFGNVGQSFARLLLDKEGELETHYGVSYSVTGIATGTHGMAINHDGIDLRTALELASSGDSLQKVSAKPYPISVLELIQNCEAHVLFENSPVNYETGQPAINHIRAALEMDMHAITANKGPVVHAHQQLTKIAEIHERKFFFESTVMDGAPIFSLFREALPGANLKGFRGILNSTTNLILTRMEQGASLEQSIQYAQSIGIAETDPSGDVDGWDAAIKVSALATVLMNVPLKPMEIDRQGISKITPGDVAYAREQGKRWKLVCSAERSGEKVKARVAPEMVNSDSPLYNIEGTTSIVQFQTDVLGLLSVIEANPGPDTTAYGLLADFLNAIKS
jgi:homoserine dehydrogenase